MLGTKLPDETSPHLYKPGEYGKYHGSYHGCTPNGELANLGGHEVHENENGTITVSPSILVSDGTTGTTWHGYLIDGVWKEC